MPGPGTGRALRGELLLPRAISTAQPPAHLSPTAAEHWTTLVRDLGPAGMLSDVDQTALALLCETMADYWGLRKQIRQQSGDLDFEQAVAAARGLASMDSTIRAWLQELLLTPRSRATSMPVRQRDPDEAIDLSNLAREDRDALKALLERATIEGRVQ